MVINITTMPCVWIQMNSWKGKSMNDRSEAGLLRRFGGWVGAWERKCGLLEAVRPNNKRDWTGRLTRL